ncbi:MAG: FdtA/QdtA family cupin domain-containing protein [Lachnospiraceae bacterium]|nr:FdtA/QdtA family cupin domain-containing protein [Lachnospiraceae bacterium]
MRIRVIRFPIKGDNRGSLIALEQNKDIPFKIRRVYYITDTKPGVVRGHHAHKKLKQVLICVHGSCKIGLDNGYEQEEVVLDSIDKGLVIEHNIWRTMYDFSEGAVLLVLASELYDPDDYIKDYQEFIKYIRREKA